MISATLCWVQKALGKCDFLTIFVKIYLFLLLQVVKLNTVQHIFPHTSCEGTTVSPNICEAVTISCLHTVTSKPPSKMTIQAKTVYWKPLTKLTANDPVLQGQCQFFPSARRLCLQGNSVGTSPGTHSAHVMNKMKIKRAEVRRELSYRQKNWLSSSYI